MPRALCGRARPPPPWPLATTPDLDKSRQISGPGADHQWAGALGELPILDDFLRLEIFRDHDFSVKNKSCQNCLKLILDHPEHAYASREVPAVSLTTSTAQTSHPGQPKIRRGGYDVGLNFTK